MNKRWMLKACTVSFIAAIAISAQSKPKLGAESFTTAADDDEEEKSSDDDDDDDKDQSSSIMELIKVQSIFRHGARTPIGEIPRTRISLMNRHDDDGNSGGDHTVVDERIVWDNCEPFETLIRSSMMKQLSHKEAAAATEDENHGSMESSRRGGRGTFHKFQTMVVPNEQHLLGTCMRGQLTMEGMKQMEEIGHEYAQRYGSWIQSHMNHNNNNNKGTSTKNQKWIDLNQFMFVRTTDVAPRRTEQSAQGFLTGLLNHLMMTTTKQEQHQEQSSKYGSLQTVVSSNLLFVPPIIYKYEYTLENMYPNTRICPKIGHLLREMKDKDQFLQSLDERPDVAELRRQLKDIFHLPSDATISVTHSGEGNDSIPTLEALHNGFQMYLFHGKPLPNGIKAQHVTKVASVVSEAANRMFAIDHANGKELTSLSVGLFLHELVGNMDHAISHASYPHSSSLLKNKPMELYFGHDTTILPILSAVGAIDQIKEWPMVGSHVSFELWRNKQTSQHFVRAIFNGMPLLLPGASSHFCSYDAFRKICANVKPENFQAQCLSHRVRKTVTTE